MAAHQQHRTSDPGGASDSLSGRPVKDFFDMFDVVIQLGAILAVVVSVLEQDLALLPEEKSAAEKGRHCKIRKRSRNGKCGTEHGCFLDVGEDRCSMYPCGRLRPAV